HAPLHRAEVNSVFAPPSSVMNSRRLTSRTIGESLALAWRRTPESATHTFPHLIHSNYSIASQGWYWGKHAGLQRDRSDTQRPCRSAITRKTVIEPSARRLERLGD